jgi:hypothetical protein
MKQNHRTVRVNNQLLDNHFASALMMAHILWIEVRKEKIGAWLPIVDAVGLVGGDLGQFAVYSGTRCVWLDLNVCRNYEMKISEAHNQSLNWARFGKGGICLNTDNFKFHNPNFDNVIEEHEISLGIPKYWDSVIWREGDGAWKSIAG